MEAMWPTVLVNAAVLIALAGALWRVQNGRLDRLQDELAKKTGQELCEFKHQGIREDLQELKQSQKRMMATLEEIRVRLAKENGRKEAMEKRP